MNNINFILVFFLMLSNINCNIKSLSNEFDSSSNLNTIDLEQRYPFVKMKRTPCFGKCPYYEFVIFSTKLKPSYKTSPFEKITNS